MRPQFRTCSPFCFSCKLSNPLYFYLFYFFPLSSSLIPLCLPPHSLYFCVGSPSQRDGLQQPAVHPDFQAFPHLHPYQSRPQQQAEGTLTSPPLLTFHLVACCLFVFYLFFCSLVWVYKSNCAPLALRRISTCPYLWMMMILLVNQCRLLAPAATLPSSFIFFFLWDQIHRSFIPLLLSTFTHSATCLA